MLPKAKHLSYYYESNIGTNHFKTKKMGNNEFIIFPNRKFETSALVTHRYGTWLTQ